MLYRIILGRRRIILRSRIFCARSFFSRTRAPAPLRPVFDQYGLSKLHAVFRFSDSSPTMIRRRRIAESQALLFFAFLPAFATRVDDVFVVFFPPSLVALRARLGLMGSVISSIRSEI